VRCCCLECGSGLLCRQHFVGLLPQVGMRSGPINQQHCRWRVQAGTTNVCAADTVRRRARSPTKPSARACLSPARTLVERGSCVVQPHPTCV
jgi:hypothetical protein